MNLGKVNKHMSIPAWRKVEYTDDGCSIYECLSCYKKWESRTDPEWAGWQFCPYCGVGWERRIEDKEDKVFSRRQQQYNKLDSDSEITLEVRHYEKADDGSYNIIHDWDWVTYGMHFTKLPSYTVVTGNHKDAPDLYKEYLYKVRIADLIKDLAANYKDDNNICQNFFMFSDGYELRLKIKSRISGETTYIALTDDITPVIQFHPDKEFDAR
jgi:hypothetical protein